MHESGWICISLSQIIWSHIYSWTGLMDPLSIIMLPVLFFMGYYKLPNAADIEKWMQIAPKLNVPTGMCAYINIDKKYIRGVCVHVGAINRTTMPHYKRNQALYLCIQTRPIHWPLFVLGPMYWSISKHTQIPANLHVCVHLMVSLSRK